MTREKRLDDPTAERAIDQSTQSAGGLTAGRERDEVGDGPGVERNRAEDDVVRRRPEEHDDTPRRYEEEVEDPVMPSDDPSLGTKI
jgi:hypothetical protein